ncbi:hypothetical protein I4U23_022925 [Adineta vaga]|nr:hypothetical protein I4U23_022925 [Adineta vaga]
MYRFQLLTLFLLQLTAFFLYAQTKSLKGVCSTSPSDHCNEIDRLNASWYYNWLPISNCTPSPTAAFIPMIWSDAFMDKLPLVNSSGAPVLLTFNEPDFDSQSNMTVELAVSLWPLIEREIDPQIKISSPAPTSSPAGQRWLLQFMIECVHCRIDIIALHYYNTCDADTFFSFLNTWTIFGLPIWLTEFDCMTKSEEDNVKFAQSVIPLMAERVPLLQRYAWFATRTDIKDKYYYGCALFNATTSELTRLGRVYRAL